MQVKIPEWRFCFRRQKSVMAFAITFLPRVLSAFPFITQFGHLNIYFAGLYRGHLLCSHCLHATLYFCSDFNVTSESWDVHYGKEYRKRAAPLSLCGFWKQKSQTNYATLPKTCFHVVYRWIFAMSQDKHTDNTGWIWVALAELPTDSSFNGFTRIHE